MSPQLKTAGADPEDAGEELIRLKEVRDVKVLGQVWELFPQISRFLSERDSPGQVTSAETHRGHSVHRDKNLPSAHPLPVNEGSSSHPGIRPSPLSQDMILEITNLTSLFDDGYLTQEEVGVFLFRGPFHELFERQSPVNEQVWLENVQRQEVVRSFVGERAHLYAKFLRRKSICGTVDTWIFTSLSPPFCPRYSTVHLSRQGPRLRPRSTAGLRWNRTHITETDRGLKKGGLVLYTNC